MKKADDDTFCDIEDYQVRLCNLQAELKREYESRIAQGEKRIAIEILSGERRFRLL